MEKLYLKTNRIAIRNLQPQDLEDFYAYRSDEEVTRYQGFDVMTKDACAAFIAAQQDKLFGKPGEWVQYGIEDEHINKLVGDCAIKLDGSDPRIAEIGITIAQPHWKKGYAKEALAEIVRFLFEEKSLHRIVEIVDAENTASIALLKSADFRQEGHFIEHIFFKGKWGSEYQYALLRREWEQAV